MNHFSSVPFLKIFSRSSDRRDSTKISSDQRDVPRDSTKISSSDVPPDSTKISSDRSDIPCDSTKASSDRSDIPCDSTKISSDRNDVPRDSPKMSFGRSDAEICIVCPLSHKDCAAKAILEEAAGAGADALITGKVGGRDAVLVHPPMGTVPTAAVIDNLKKSFANIKLVLVLGTCGGVPDESDDGTGIRLGDVVIGKSVVHYEFGKEKAFTKKDSPKDGLGKQNPEIQKFIRKLENGEGVEEKTAEYITAILESLGQGSEITGLQDNLYEADYWHAHTSSKGCSNRKCKNGREVCDSALRSTCEDLGCDSTAVEQRERKERPNVHFGSVASAENVVKSAVVRDNIANEEGVIAFDTAIAGMWDYLPCILIKGVSDYADGHKNGRWRDYAAVTSAACAKVVLEQWVEADKPEKKKKAKIQFNNYNSNIANQAAKINNTGTQNFHFGK